MTSTSSAHLTCLCGAISAPGTLLSGSEIPLSISICHCNICRQTTGSLGASFPTLNSPPSTEILAKLTSYKSSQFFSRYFCSNCGCHCFVVDHRSKEWYCLGGIIEPSLSSKTDNIAWPKDTIKISSHDFVLDTVDGGLVPPLLNLNGRSIPTWSAAPQFPQQDTFDLLHAAVLSLPGKSAGTLPQPEESSYLTAKCHCGAVSLLIKRANYTSTSNSKDSARYIPSDPTKYLTYLCACRSCRLSTGVSLTPWALVPSANVFNANTSTDDDSSSISSNYNLQPVVFGHAASNPNANLGLAIKHNWSSPDVCRSFCVNCGATVFYWRAQRPDELDLAVGILRSEEGSMARRWLEWDWGRCSFIEESIDAEMCEAWLWCANKMKRIGC